MRILIYCLIVISGMLIMVGLLKRNTSSETIESVVMPGPLSQVHAQFENQCSQCHSAFSKQSQESLCLKCHEQIVEDLTNHSGFHGKNEINKASTCKDCHTEHEGRSFDIIGLDPVLFNHSLTDFQLVGAHADKRLTCDVCHKQGQKFREAPMGCVNCHENDDRHRGTLGADCASCHKETSWKDTYFDHSQTKFPLKGSHQQVTCNACHLNNKYENIPANCSSCHLINDIHNSPPQENCDRCHNEDKWGSVHFDHQNETAFKLDGKHLLVSCDTCHDQLVFVGQERNNCADCHLSDDIHKGRYKTSCNDCHNTTGWSNVSFDHAKDTKFPLIGKHAQAGCEACHKNNNESNKLSSQCIECHKAQDVHQGQFQSCDSCHNTNGWNGKIRFDHDLSSFPLIGIHAVTSCEQCHTSLAFKDVKPGCVACHTKDDFHKQTMGDDCSSCHNPNSWQLWEFDHNTATDFKLEGAHDKLACQSCHNKPVVGRVRISNNCAACHSADDVHNGGFGRRCDRCHGTENFKQIIIGDKNVIFK